MSKFPRFGVWKNPMAEPGAEYIYHSQQPRFLAKKVDEAFNEFEIVDEIDNMAEFFNHQPEKIAGLLKRMSDWWIAYKKWEDNNGNRIY